MGNGVLDGAGTPDWIWTEVDEEVKTQCKKTCRQAIWHPRVSSGAQTSISYVHVRQIRAERSSLWVGNLQDMCLDCSPAYAVLSWTDPRFAHLTWSQSVCNSTCRKSPHHHVFRLQAPYFCVDSCGPGLEGSCGPGEGHAMRRSSHTCHSGTQWHTCACKVPNASLATTSVRHSAGMVHSCNQLHSWRRALSENAWRCSAEVFHMMFCARCPEFCEGLIRDAALCLEQGSRPGRRGRLRLARKVLVIVRWVPTISQNFDNIWFAMPGAQACSCLSQQVFCMHAQAHPLRDFHHRGLGGRDVLRRRFCPALRSRDAVMAIRPNPVLSSFWSYRTSP